MSMEYGEDSSAQCGDCGKYGSLKEIQVHFLQTHCQVEDPETETRPGTETDIVNNLNSNQSTNKVDVENFHWKDEHVLLLIRLVEKYDEDFNNGLKKKVWIKIAREMSNIMNTQISHEQVDTKWKGLKKTYKKIKDHNSQTGNSLKRWHFFQAMDSFLSKKPEVQPIAACTSTHDKIKVDSGVIPDQPTVATTTAKGPKKRKLEERHEEKMQKFDKFLKLFQISVEHQIGRKIEEDE